MRISRKMLVEFATKVMEKVGCSEEKARIVSDVLVEADMRGISSHGVSRLKRYVDHISEGIIDPFKEPEIIFETPVSLVIDGNNGIGQCIAKYTMEKVIEKTKKNGICMATVRNSNHYGIAGYYAEMAAKEGFVGLSMTNAAPLVVHTFSKEAVLGTNPLAFAFPTKGKYPILVDMATSVVSRGKLEVYARLGKNIPKGWAMDEMGEITTNPKKVLENLKMKKDGGLLPLGGEGEKFGGHKGYGLGLIVELLSSALSVGAFSFETYKNKGKIAHFFAAFDLSLFGNAKEIKEHVEFLMEKLKNARKVGKERRIYLHGEKEYEKREESLKLGVEIDEPTFKQLKELSKELNLKFDLQNS